MKTDRRLVMTVWVGILTFMFTAACLAEPVNQEQVRQMVAGQWLILQSARGYSLATVTFSGN